MEKYNYYDAVTSDIKNYIDENIDIKDYESIENMEETLYNELFCEDSVTGNASGSYTFSTAQAEENLSHNLELLGDALDTFGCGPEYIRDHGPEACDVTVRCYLLSECLHEVIQDYESCFEDD